MTVKDYEERIMNATTDTRLSDIARMYESDARLTDADLARLKEMVRRRLAYFAALLRA